MTTRASLARGQGHGPFQGRVRKWIKKWITVDRNPTTAFQVLKWVPTEDKADIDPTLLLQKFQPLEGGHPDQTLQLQAQAQPVISQPSPTRLASGTTGADDDNTAAGSMAQALEPTTASTAPAVTQEARAQVESSGQIADTAISMPHAPPSIPISEAIAASGMHMAAVPRGQLQNQQQQ